MEEFIRELLKAAAKHLHTIPVRKCDIDSESRLALEQFDAWDLGRAVLINTIQETLVDLPQAENTDSDIRLYVTAKRALEDIERLAERYKFLLAENVALQAGNADLKSQINQYKILLDEEMIVVKEILQEEVQ